MASQPPPTRTFTALYTHQKHKKAKTWQDGTAHYHHDAREIVLFDANSSFVASYRLRAKESIQLENEYDIGRFLLTLEGEESGGKDAVPVAESQPGPLMPRPAKRAKRLPSLIKPIRVKGVAPAVDKVQGSSAVAVEDEPAYQPAAQPTASPTCAKRDTIEYTALYTNQKLKKAKTWSDGQLMFHPSDRRITLKNEDGVTVTTMLAPGSMPIEAGSEIDVGRYLIQIEGEKGKEPVAPANGGLGPSKPQLRGLLRKRHSALHTTNPAAKKMASAPASASVLHPPKRALFVPPKSNIPKYLHFPRRGELMQHADVSKGYGLGPPRALTAPVKYSEWTEYRDCFSGLLRENMMAEMSVLAIRYFFMAHERYKERGGKLVQLCKSVGVLYFEECTIRQPFMDSSSFKAQRDRGSVRFAKGDSIILELSRREAYASYGKDDTWAISASDDFASETSFLARSVFFGPSKNNTLELMLAGEDDAKAAARMFAGKGPGSVNSAPTVVAIRCLDSLSDWSMVDTVEEVLDPETLPLLPHLLGQDHELPPPVYEDDESDTALVRIDAIMAESKRSLHLNEDQYTVLRQIVMSAVSIYVPVDDATSITIVHGPLGTGKSFLIAAATACLDQIASEYPQIFRSPEKPRMRVLLASMTNFAVDNMLNAMLKQDYDTFLRVGNLKRISKQILPYVYRSSSSADDDIKELEAMLKVATDEIEHDAIQTAIQRIRQQNARSTIEEAFVVGTTCLSAAAASLRGIQFPLVILDEACQIVEPMALIVLANAGCQRLVLVGDPLQLPPTLTTRATRDAEGKGLDRALFDRLEEMGHIPRFLSTQYRCHPRIGSLCNQLFYQGRLRHGIGADSRPPLIPGVPALAFLDAAGQEKQHGKSQSFFNKGEIDMTVQLTCQLLMGGVRPESIGVIALYKTQSDMLREQLATALGPLNRVQVSTVDAYQGSERDVIIISCVRTGKIGFIANPNRVNVALSRARHHCLILGSRKLLETNGMWRSIIGYCREDVESGVLSAQVLVNRIASTVAECATGAQADRTSPQPESVRLDAIDERSYNASADSDDECSRPLELYGSEGMMSQWSPLLGADSENDVLDCLEVDLDDM